MPRGETRIFAPGVLPAASAKLTGRTQIFHGLPAPIQPAPKLGVPDFAASGPKTRVMPIEELLAPPQPAGATAATRGWHPMTRGRKLRLALGLVAMAVAAYSSIADVRASTPPVVVAPPALEAPASAPATAATEEPKPVARKAKRARNRGASPRRAGDQLAAGDLARAAKTYDELAARSDDPVYAEAARILRLRVARPGP